MVFGEDASQVRCGNIPQVMAAVRNATLTLLRTSGNTEIVSTLRYFVAIQKRHSHLWEQISTIECL